MCARGKAHLQSMHHKKIGVPRPSPDPNRRKQLLFTEHQKKKSPPSAAPKIAETPPPVALRSAWLSRGGYACEDREVTTNRPRSVLQGNVV